MKKFLFVFIALLSYQHVYSANLKVLTINVWSGLDYKGISSFGEYEAPERRESRFRLLLEQLRESGADVIFLQEANPAGEYSQRLADSLNMDEIHFRCNSGLKIADWGIPSNINEGIAILAEKALNLRPYEIVQLNGAPGIYSDNFSLHFNESHFALVGKIVFNNFPVYLINTHLIASAPLSAETADKFKIYSQGKGASSGKIQKIINKSVEASSARNKEISRLISYTEKFQPKTLIILGGDINSSPNSIEVKRLTDSLYFDTAPPDEPFYTWDAENNDNIKLQNEAFNQQFQLDKDSYDNFADRFSRKLDYIFLNSELFKKSDVMSSKIILNKSEAGLFPSDHYGYMTEISFDNFEKRLDRISRKISLYGKQHAEPMPIASYDYDIGLGLGVKLFLKNQMMKNESFDFILFGSTRGELWGRFGFSIPDFSIRQGKIYPLAFDFVVDYDRYLKNNFFGIGNKTKWKDREFYTKEPLDLSFNFSRSFSETMVLSAGLRYMFVRNYNLSDSSKIRELPSVNHGRIDYYSLFTSFGYDSRNNYLNPSSGIVAKASLEWAPNTAFSNLSFGKAGLSFQHYLKLFFPTTVLATRFMFQSLIGEGEMPIQVLLPIGGNRTIRGYPQDRFLDKVSALANVELRFPIYWRFGGIVGYDAGKVWSSSNKIGLKNWAYNSAVGLRFEFETFIIRADYGFSKETGCLYLNFDHIF